MYNALFKLLVSPSRTLTCESMLVLLISFESPTIIEFLSSVNVLALPRIMFVQQSINVFDDES